MGVFYHLRHPLLALDLIHEHVAKDRLLFQTMQRGSAEIDPVQEDYDFFDTEHLDRPGYPKMVFFEHRYSHDPTNWWAPNAACAEAMLRASGFEIVAHPEQEVYLCRRIELPAAPDGLRAVHPAVPNARTPEGSQKLAGGRRPPEEAHSCPTPKGSHSEALR